MEPMHPWSKLRWIHLVVGVAVLLAFLGTGQFMDRRLDHLIGMADAPRSLYRSSHIYILFSALLNLVLGTYVVRAPVFAARLVQYAGSALLLATAGLFLYGFFVETPLATIERPAVRTGIYWSLYGVLLHGAAALLPAAALRPSPPEEVKESVDATSSSSRPA